VKREVISGPHMDHKLAKGTWYNQPQDDSRDERG
jgi:hypothetical protein